MKNMKQTHMRAPKSEVGHRILPVLAALFICCIAATGISIRPVSAASDNPSGPAQLAPLRPQLTATLIMPTVIHFCQNFNFSLTVINYGNAPAGNVHLYFQNFPGDFFTLLDVDHASNRMNKHTEDIDLGNLAPNHQKTVNFVVYTPFQKQLNAEWLRKFYFNFSTSYDYAPEQMLGRIMFLAGYGKIQVQRYGFTQP